jgi:hypothetical protein
MTQRRPALGLKSQLEVQALRSYQELCIIGLDADLCIIEC